MSGAHWQAVKVSVSCLVAVVAVGCGGGGDEAAPKVSATKSASSAVDLKALEGTVKFCDSRKEIGTTDAIVPEGTVQRVTEAADAYKQSPTPELKATLVELQGCSSETDAVLTSALGSGAPEPSKEADNRSECEKEGIAGPTIEAQDAKQGTCFLESGVEAKFVNRRTKLTLDELDVSYTGYSTDKRLSASTGTERADGTFVTLSLKVTNKLDEPVALDPEQIELLLEDSNYSTDFDAMNMPGDSFVWNDDEIQPGNSRSGTVTFDVPENRVDTIEESGVIAVYQFSDADTESVEDVEGTVGYIRIFK